MSLGGGIGGQKSSTTGTTTTPLTGAIPGLLPTLTGGLKGIASGSTIAQGLQAIQTEGQQQNTTGAQTLKSAYAGSGMAQSSDMMRGMSQYLQTSNQQLTAQMAGFEQTGISQQLAALAEIISMAQGSSMTTSKTSSFGWNVGASV
jgi:hypothetical protein